MIHRIVDTSARNPIIVIAMVLAACCWGAWAMFHVSLDAIPDLGETQVIIY